MSDFPTYFLRLNQRGGIQSFYETGNRLVYANYTQNYNINEVGGFDEYDVFLSGYYQDRINNQTSYDSPLKSLKSLNDGKEIILPEAKQEIKFLSTLSRGEFECKGSSEKTSIAAPPKTEL